MRANGCLSAIIAPRIQKITRDLTRKKTRKNISFYLSCKQLHVSERFSQLKETNDASKEASNQQLYVRMLGSSVSSVS